MAQERDRPDVRAARHLWTSQRQARMRAEPHRLIFLDETAVKTNLTRLRGWAPVGQRLYGSAPFGKWRTQTFIAGLTSDELIAPWVIEGAMNRTAFDTYIETQLAPLLNPGTVVILDNLSTHKSPRAAEALKEAKSWFLFLPPYSPDLNPIEQAFAKLKHWLRQAQARSITELNLSLADILQRFPPEQCAAFFENSGYASA